MDELHVATVPIKHTCHRRIWWFGPIYGEISPCHRNSYFYCPHGPFPPTHPNQTHMQRITWASQYGNDVSALWTHQHIAMASAPSIRICRQLWKYTGKVFLLPLDWWPETLTWIANREYICESTTYEYQMVAKLSGKTKWKVLRWELDGEMFMNSQCVIDGLFTICI